ncbi:unnamed protein product, partial [marine sediment metagenome]
ARYNQFRILTRPPNGTERSGVVVRGVVSYK